MKSGYIRQITFRKKFRCFKAGETFKFQEGVNLLVGEQGSGKSTLLGLITGKFGYNTPDKEDRILDVDGDRVTYFVKDFEKENPRITKSEDGFVPFTFKIKSMFSSHGEVVNILLQALEKAKDNIIFIDEPDMALSIRSTYKLVNLLKTLENNRCQILAAVHHPIIISAFDNVLSLEHRKWVTSINFIEDHSPIRRQ